MSTYIQLALVFKMEINNQLFKLSVSKSADVFMLKISIQNEEVNFHSPLDVQI